MSEEITSMADAIKKGKLLSYLQQENEVLHAKVAKLEISLASEREACAKVAEEYANKWDEVSSEYDDYELGRVKGARDVTALIRGRGEK